MFRLALSIIAALSFVGVSPLSRAHAADATRPNILFLLSDDQRFDTLGCMGDKIIQTPHLDSLSRRGTTFDNAFVTTSICMTSRASILRGQYAARHGIIDFRTMFTPDELAKTYVGRLKESGYRVGFIGKWGVGSPPGNYFHYDKTFPGQGRYRVPQPDGTVKHLTNIMGDQAIEFLEGGAKGDGRPWCLSVSFKAAHVQDEDKKEPFHYDPDLASLYAEVRIPMPIGAERKYHDALPEFLRKSENRVRWTQRFSTPDHFQQSVKAYYRLITGMDANIGRMIARLRELKMDGNTIIIFTSDNGFFLGDYGLAGKWLGHDVSIRVPLIIHDPRLPEAARGRRRSEYVLNIDLAPTILEAAALKPDERMQGKSLWRLVRGEDVQGWRSEVFHEHHFKHPGIPRSESVRTRQWKYSRYLDSDPLYEELYDLKNDPHELKNLAGDASHGQTLKQMRQRWENARAEAR